MTNINRKLKWLLLVLPLAGCATSVPLDVPSNKEVIISSQTSTQTTIKSVVQPPVTGVSEVKTVIEKKETEVRTSRVEAQPTVKANPLGIPGDINALNNPRNIPTKTLNVDPNVKLIAPPVGMPKTAYVVPEVEEKEEYVPRAASVKVKEKETVTSCTKNKKGKKICKISEKTENKVKAKKGSSAKAVKSSSKASTKSVSKKATATSKKKPEAKEKKK
jgi:hypothetical protein